MNLNESEKSSSDLLDIGRLLQGFTTPSRKITMSFCTQIKQQKSNLESHFQSHYHGLIKTDTCQLLYFIKKNI